TPSAVNTLDFKTVSGSAVTLRWNAPGDDGVTGRACCYDLRWSTAPIADADFNSDTMVTNPPTPSVAGTAATNQITALPQHTWLYFAMKTTDESGNVSALSNVACIKLGSPNQYCEGGGFTARRTPSTETGSGLALQAAWPNPNRGS